MKLRIVERFDRFGHVWYELERRRGWFASLFLVPWAPVYEPGTDLRYSFTNLGEARRIAAWLLADKPVKIHEL